MRKHTHCEDRANEKWNCKASAEKASERHKNKKKQITRYERVREREKKYQVKMQ